MGSTPRPPRCYLKSCRAKAAYRERDSSRFYCAKHAAACCDCVVLIPKEAAAA